MTHRGPVDGRILAASESVAAGPDDPAVFFWRPESIDDPSGFVTSFLTSLEAALVALYPAWLPGAEGVTDATGSSEFAVRSLAHSVGASTEHHGPYLAALASQSLRPDPTRPIDFPPEVRAQEGSRVFAAAYERGSVLAIIEIPALNPEEEDVLAHSAAFLARHGRLAVWLVGPPLTSVDWISTAHVDMPTEADEAPAEHKLPPTWFAPLAGQPHPASQTEQALEAALTRTPWARGRRWNHRYQPDPLASPMTLDLVWLDERLVVELDGPEHRTPSHYEADRRRDVLLALDGFTVVRFTNETVADDLSQVVSQLERLVHNHRHPPTGG